MTVPEALGTEDYCYLTTVGRITGRPHTIEIWFGLNGSTLYMMAGGRNGADWVRNIRTSPSVRVRIRDIELAGQGRIVESPDEDAMARALLLSKYQPRYNGDLTEWGRTALPVAVDLAPRPA